MATALAYLLDTNVVLLATRENSAVSLAIEERFRLKNSPFRPAVCEVTIGELLAFAQSSKWGEPRRQVLRTKIDELVVIPISRADVHLRWAELYSYARANGLAIQQDHNDVWIAATARVTGARLLTTDKAAFAPLRGTPWLDVVVLDPKTGQPIS